MCAPASMIVTEHKLYWSRKSESHTDIIEEFGLRERNVRGEYLFLPVEITPPEGTDYLTPLNKWVFSIEIWDYERDCVPDWYDRDEVEKRVRAELKRWYKQKVVKPNQFREIKDEQVICYGKVISRGNGNVTVRGKGMVEAYDKSKVIACEDSAVMAYDHSNVEAYHSAMVTVNDYVRASSYNGSFVMSLGNSVVSAYDYSLVNAYDRSKITSLGESTVVAYCKSSVTACQHSTVKASDDVVVNAGKDSVVVLYDNAKVKTQDPSITVIDKR